MQFLVSELAQEETNLLKPHLDYPVWSPYNAFEAANLANAIKEGEETEIVSRKQVFKILESES